MADLVSKLQHLKSAIGTAVDEIVQKSSKTLPDEAEVAISMSRVEKLASQLKNAVTPPSVFNMGMLFLPYQYLAVQIGLEMHIFDHVTSHTSLASLVESTKADRQLLFRIMRTLTSLGYFVHEGDGTYSSTALAQNLLLPPMRSFVACPWSDGIWEMHKGLVSFLKQNQWRNPDDSTQTAARHALGQSFWDFINANPVRRGGFDCAMEIQEHYPKYMLPSYGFMCQAPLMQTGANAVTIVDVGGGSGQVLESIRRDYPSLTGRFILQDLPETISQIDSAKMAALKIEPQAYDFFTPQPIQGAKYYHLRRILHDWPNSACLQILGRIHEAMSPTAGHSRLLMQEWILPDIDVNLNETLVDLAMMEIFSGMERSHSQWTELLAEAGFKITKLHRAKVGSTGMIEAEVNVN